MSISFKNLRKLSLEQPNERAVPNRLQTKPRVLFYLEFVFFFFAFIVGLGCFEFYSSKGATLTFYVWLTLVPLIIISCYLSSQDSPRFRIALATTALYFSLASAISFFFSIVFKVGCILLTTSFMLWLYLYKPIGSYHKWCEEHI